MPDIAHTFRAGHRIMVQVQSSWFLPGGAQPPAIRGFVELCGVGFRALPGDALPPARPRFVRLRPQTLIPMQLRIALCQTDIAWEQPARNLARLEPLVAGADADVVVLPGSCSPRASLLDPAPGRRSPPAAGGRHGLRRWGRYGKAVAGSVAVAEGGRFFNRMPVTPDGAPAMTNAICSRPAAKPELHARQRPRGGWIPGFGFFAARLLRPAVPWYAAAGTTTPSCAASWPASRPRGVADAAARPGCREPMLRRGVTGGGTTLGALRRGFARRFQASHDGRGRRPSRRFAAFDADALEAFRCKFPAWRDADDFLIRM